MQRIKFLLILLFSGCCNFSLLAQESGFAPYQLIAHRGGVVNDTFPENSLAALEEAIKRGYDRVEVDVRLTKDSVLITHHDRDFKRYYGVDREVSAMTWEEIRELTGRQGQHVLSLATVLSHCQGKIKVMIDNKISGFSKPLFDSLLALLDAYGLRSGALMIGTEASTEYFTGKLKLSCSLDQLKENRNRADFSPDHYYLFSTAISPQDFEWATEQGFLVVAAVNAWVFESGRIREPAEMVVENLKRAGVRTFQIDSVYEPFFR
ncbi:glycerophosphodiester phosphodiesterase [Cyclobacterium jeungdonense]|uniref:Glycerophosphodiester phosphodiesterase family protein n=1 Tax=Cyclobacterium jeungdonense TaxID=708087 RepID=A0ABT8C2U9_9BACT|nr:glycerophosphodiester phosphodiesterase family protein [Cyclobacterium jeungdonense]MDN3686367.1 glycerophosphodiester phosphodiesterase family protein [Cyclobacterium jeungdonense]